MSSENPFKAPLEPVDSAERSITKEHRKSGQSFSQGFQLGAKFGAMCGFCICSILTAVTWIIVGLSRHSELERGTQILPTDSGMLIGCLVETVVLVALATLFAAVVSGIFFGSLAGLRSKRWS